MELLAPAGDFDSLRAAVACGADAVYLGMSRFGARASAVNFDSESLPRAVKLCHLHGVKVYVTLNTLIGDDEMKDSLSAARFAFDAGADAFIVQDMGLICKLRETIPGIVLHASTQMGICNAYGAEFVKRFGINRVVVARETLEEDITDIKRRTGLEIEAFCHGALCVAYSGNCYYSSLVSGCSGNRGRCLQLCRKQYETDGKSGYFLSAKDICLVDKIELLRNAGVDSLKIEGRMRAPEYVAETVSVYRDAIDGKRTAGDIDRLKRVFNRGDYCKAYFLNPTENVIFPSVQNNMGLFAGKVESVEKGRAEIKSRIKLGIGDGVKYLRHGREVSGGLIDGNPTRCKSEVKAGDEVRLTSCAEVKKKVESLNSRLPASISVDIRQDREASLTLTCRGVTVTVFGTEKAEKADKRAVTAEDVKKAVGTLGGTDFELADIKINLDENTFYPASVIKDMRKRTVTEAEKKILGEYDKSKARFGGEISAVKLDWLNCPDSAVFVRTDSAAKLAKLKFDYDYVILAPDDYGDYESVARELKAVNKKVLLDLPFIMRGGDVGLIERLKALPFFAFVANNAAHLEMFSDKTLLGGIGLNHLNSSFGGTFIESVESDKRREGINYAFGKPPYMHFAHCPKKNSGGNCTNCGGYDIRMKDDKGAYVHFRRIKEKYCYGVLIPEIPIVNIGTKYEKRLFDIKYASDGEIAALNDCMLRGAEYSGACTHANIGRKLQ